MLDMTISIIIPTFCEEASLSRLLPLLYKRATFPTTLEIIIADASPDDKTRLAAKEVLTKLEVKNFKVIEVPKGRGKQMHEASKIATGDILYFLHADSYPPRRYDYFIKQAVKNGHEAGCFRMRFRSNHWWLVLIGWFTRFSWKVSRGGDQSQFITRVLYNNVGGYNTEIPFFEDYDLIHKLYALEKYHVIPEMLSTSARRYRAVGVYKLQWFFLTIYWKKYRGASIDEIYVYYKKWCDLNTAP